MPRDLLRVWMQLDDLYCRDEGDGWGNAEPYLWTVFFKFDGETVRLGEDLQLSGTATILATPGSHGNLGTSDVDAGNHVAIPEAIGTYDTFLKPIPVPDFVKALGTEDLGGVVGVATVLMEEDNVTDSGAEAGHQALNTGVQNAINAIIPTLGVTHQEVTDEDIDRQIGAVEGAISDAIQNQQNFFENLWSWLNKDDKIGTKVWYFKHDDLASGEVKTFSQRWRNEGDWELGGHINATVACSAEAIVLLEALFGNPVPDIRAFERPLASMRAFRDREFLHRRGLQAWWNLAQEHVARLSYALAMDKNVRTSAVRLLLDMPNVLKNRDKPLSEQFMNDIQRILVRLQDGSARRTRIDASRALDVLDIARGKTFDQVLDLLSAVEPARHPRANGGPRVSKQAFAKRAGRPTQKPTTAPRAK